MFIYQIVYRLIIIVCCFNIHGQQPSKNKSKRLCCFKVSQPKSRIEHDFDNSPKNQNIGEYRLQSAHQEMLVSYILADKKHVKETYARMLEGYRSDWKTDYNYSTDDIAILEKELLLKYLRHNASNITLVYIKAYLSQEYKLSEEVINQQIQDN